MFKKLLSLFLAAAMFSGITPALNTSYTGEYATVFAADEESGNNPETSPEATGEPEPEATDKPEPEESVAPEETNTPEPTKTPRPTRTPKPDRTPEPTPGETEDPYNTDLESKNVTVKNSGTYDFENINSSKSLIIEDGLKDVIINLTDVRIISSAPIILGKDCTVTINISGNNELEATSGNAAIFVPASSSLTIKGSGSLSVVSTGNGAAIGSDNTTDAGVINITGGKIIAVAGKKGAAIGGGNGKKATSINISGGEIYAKADDAPAIGGGSGAESVSINITGGTVEAHCGAGNAAIGGGYRKSGGKIVIKNAKVDAYAGEFGRAFGGGRYSTDSRVEIDASADVCGYVEKGACAVEESEIYGTAPMICAYYEYKEKKDEFDGKQEVVISRGSYSETVALPENYSGFFRILEQTGTYSLKTGTGGVIKNITYSSNKNSSSKKTSEKFEISSGINHFILNPSDNCYLEELTLNTGDIILTESQTSKSVSLSASTKKVTNGTCSVHKGTSIKYSYEIINDPYNIVELDGKKLTANIKVSGTYPVTIRVRAECGTLETEKDFVINAVKQTAVHDLSKEDLYIKSNGVYTTKNSSTRYNITVAPDLDDVNIIFTNGFTLDMSKDTTLRKSPIVIGDNSKVTITRTSSVILKSTDDGSCISGGKNSVITVKGNGTFTLDSYDKGNCITGGTVYLLDGKYNMSAEDGALIKANNLFIADNVDDLSGHTENNKSYPLDAKYMTEKYETYEPAYVIQGKLSNSFTGDNSSITVQKTSGTSKTSSSETVSGLNKDTKSFAVKVATYGNYKASFKDGGGVSKDYSVKDGSRSVTEITLAEEREYIASNEYVFNECKCKLSAPVFSMDKIILPYDKKSASYALDADGAILKVDDDCKIHNKNASVSYRYTIDTDKDEIASISDGRIRFNVDDPGKYSVKVTATARMDSIESSKSITISVTRLSQEETSKQRGELHKAYLNGYSDDTFKPDNNITRAEAAAMLTSALDYEIDDDADVGFFDVSRKSWYYDVVLSVEQAKVFSGYEDGSFRPDNNITRAEFTVAICNAFAIASNSKSTSKSKMSDMNEHWSKGYVDALVKAKYINGYEDGTFRPDNYITRAEAVAILNRAIGRTANETKMKELFVNNPFDDVKKNHWAYFEIMEAVNDHYTNEWHKK